MHLLGRTYRVACDDNEREALMQAVAYLDAKMNEIRKAGKVMGAERIAVMAALNVAHELLSVRLGTGFDVGQAKRRLLCTSSRRSMRRLQNRKSCSKTIPVPCGVRQGSYFPNR